MDIGTAWRFFEWEMIFFFCWTCSLILSTEIMSRLAADVCCSVSRGSKTVGTRHFVPDRHCDCSSGQMKGKVEKNWKKVSQLWLSRSRWVLQLCVCESVCVTVSETLRLWHHRQSCGFLTRGCSLPSVPPSLPPSCPPLLPLPPPLFSLLLLSTNCLWKIRPTR